MSNDFKILAINNATGKVILNDKKGKRHNFIVPGEHKTVESRNAFIKGHIDGKDSVRDLFILCCCLASICLLETSIIFIIKYHYHAW